MAAPEKNAADLAAEHTPSAIRNRLSEGPAHSYLRDFVFGAIDGTVTTFAIVSGVAGAELSSGIVIVLGMANLLGDGFSMAAGNFLAMRSEEQLRDRLRRTEEHHIETIPDGEREEIRQIFRRKGFSEADVERLAGIITSNRRQWIETMMAEEHGVALGGPSPLRGGLATFVAFVSLGFVPLAPFVLAYWSGAESAPYIWSVAMTAGAFFLVGALKARFVDQSWWISGLETLGLGGAAAGLAYLAGTALKGVL